MQIMQINVSSQEVTCIITHILKFQVGWTLWDYVTSSLALGVTNLLYCSSVFTLHNGKNFWDMMAKYNVNVTFMANNDIEKMHKMGMQPSKFYLDT